MLGPPMDSSPPPIDLIAGPSVRLEAAKKFAKNEERLKQSRICEGKKKQSLKNLPHSKKANFNGDSK
jgi:hypothetical protein